MCFLFRTVHPHRMLTEEDRLLRHLLRAYEHRSVYSRPVLNFNHKVTVMFGLQLIQIMELDERNQILTLNVWSHYVSIQYTCIRALFDI